MLRIRTDRGLEEARERREYKNSFVIFIAGWLMLNDLFLCTEILSGALYTIPGSALLLLVNILWVYLFYRIWTLPRFRHLREKEKMSKNLHPLSAP
jgi:hypothetical protein